MPIDSHPNQSPFDHESGTPAENNLQPDDFEGVDGSFIPEELAAQQALTAISSAQSPQSLAFLQQAHSKIKLRSSDVVGIKPRALLLIMLAIALTIIGVALDSFVIGILGTSVALLLSLAILLPWLFYVVQKWFSYTEVALLVAFCGIVTSIAGLIKFSVIDTRLLNWGRRVNWEAFGTLAEWFGALGQILIAVIAVYVAWRQYIISKDLTIQQNMLTAQQNIITQQQTIDSYFQGISDLVLDEEGLLEDWPQERAIAEGRTAAIFSSVDGSGKAKILRFLSRSKLLTPLKRDRRLGRAILNGIGGYAEDRIEGVRVIDLGVMLAGADLADNDLRWTDLSDANLVRANLSNCDLVKANFSRTILYETNLTDTDLNGTRFFYGPKETASPRSRTEPPNYQTGEYTGAVVENADFSNAKRMSDANRYYCCAWGGDKTRATIPGGCEGIPNKLGR